MLAKKTSALNPVFKIGEAEVECEETVRTLAIETFKVAYGLSPTYLQEFVCFKDFLQFLVYKSVRNSQNQEHKVWYKQF